MSISTPRLQAHPKLQEWYELNVFSGYQYSCCEALPSMPRTALCPFLTGLDIYLDPDEYERSDEQSVLLFTA
jgi:hypothetical protein